MGMEAVLREVGNDEAYVRFLIAEKDYIRSALDARGVCFDEEYNASAYPTSIGSSIHCDLIEVEAWYNSLPQLSQKVVDEWARSQSIRPIRWPSRLAKISRLVRERQNG